MHEMSRTLDVEYGVIVYEWPHRGMCMGISYVGRNLHATFPLLCTCAHCNSHSVLVYTYIANHALLPRCNHFV